MGDAAYLDEIGFYSFQRRRERFQHGATVRTSLREISGSNLIIHGNWNKIVANDSTVHGNNNIIIGSSTKLHGNSNKITSNSATIRGDFNIIDGYSLTLNGNNNKCKGNEATVCGNVNTIRGYSANVVGNNNECIGNYGSVRGNDNTIEGLSAEVIGNNNECAGDYGDVRGNDNTVGGNSVSVHGDRNTVWGRYASAYGNNNTVTGDNSSSYGGINNTVNGLPPEQEEERQHQDLQDLLQHQLLIQQTLQQNLQTFRLSLLPVQVPSFANGIVAAPSHPQRQQQIKMTLHGEDKEIPDGDNDENIEPCYCCHANQAIVLSVCCGKRMACLACTRKIYERKTIGEDGTKCLNCQGIVGHLVRVL